LYWPPQVRRLPGQRILALDLPGHGKSAGTGFHTIEGYASGLAEFIRSIGVSKVILVGHSMGGAIALQMALEYPQHVLALCLLGTGAKLRVAPAILKAAADPATFLEAVALVCELSFAAHTSPRLREVAAARMAEVRPSVLHGDFLACDAFDATGRLERVAVPTLLICGAEDKMTPPWYSEFLGTRIRGSALELVPDAGHMVMLEQPEPVARHIERFLNGIPYWPGT
jgi:pimeloyl-ACP methyl ester carboxylesterase